jgi:hypothetical protein
MEDEQEQNQDDLVDELAPTLHQEGAGYLAATVKAILPRRDLSSADGILHARGGSHGILAADSYAVEEESPDVADDPAILRHSPCGSQHEQTNKHDDGILNKAKTAAYPVTKDADQDLTYAMLADSKAHMEWQY